MNELLKYGLVKKALDLEGDLARINLQSLAPLTQESVFAFRVVACDNQVDREFEQFSDGALETLAKLFVGKSMISDHHWSASRQTARIYAGDVETLPEKKQLVLRCYMLRNDETKATIAAIEGGILREVSVYCHTTKATCSICGSDKRKVWCDHQPGSVYDGKTCTMLLDNAVDAYELSFVAVPAQPAAGVVKHYGGEAIKPEPQGTLTAQQEQALALLALEHLNN